MIIARSRPFQAKTQNIGVENSLASKPFMRIITPGEAGAFMGLFTEGEAGPRGLVSRCLPAPSGHGGSPRFACPVPFRRVGPGPTNAPSPCSPRARATARTRRFLWSGPGRWPFSSRPGARPVLFPPMSGCCPVAVLPPSSPSTVSSFAGFKNERVFGAAHGRGRWPCLTRTRAGNPKTLTNLFEIYECSLSLFAVDSYRAGGGGRPGSARANQ